MHTLSHTNCDLFEGVRVRGGGEYTRRGGLNFLFLIRLFARDIVPMGAQQRWSLRITEKVSKDSR